MAASEALVDLLKRLLPPVSYYFDDAAVDAELKAVAQALQMGADGAWNLLVQLDPSLTSELLGEWELDFGLPDMCSALAETDQERRLALVAKIMEMGGQTPAYFEAVARALGYTEPRVREFTPFVCKSACDSPVAGEGWLHVWSLQSKDAVRVTYFMCGSACTEPLTNWSLIEPLQCVINRLKPAHTLCYFHFGE